MKNYALLRFPDFKEKALTLSYDDGVIYDEKLIEILNRYGIKCTFNINSGVFAEKDVGRRLTKERAIALYKNSGHEVAVHGVKHFSLAEVPEEIAVAEVLEDRKNLEETFGCIVKGMAYANGSFNDETVEILKRCGVKYARTTVSTEKFNIPEDWLRLPATCHHNNPRLSELADEFLKDTTGYFLRRNPKLFYLWGHSYEYNDNNNWEVIENFAKKAGNRTDVWYATNGEVYDYVQAFNRLEFSVDGKLIRNTSNIDVYLNYLYDKKVKIPAGETVKVE